MNPKKIIAILIAGATLSAFISTQDIGIKANAKQLMDIEQEQNSKGEQLEETEYKVNVFSSSQNATESIELERYIKGVVTSEMSIESPIEALKAQAIASRTYAMYKVINNIKIDDEAHVYDTVGSQAYKDIDERYKTWNPAKRDEYMKKINQVIEETKGKIITYDGNIISNAHFFASTNGKTQNCEEVFVRSLPYLKSVSSPETPQTQEVKLTHWGFTKMIKEKYPDLKFTSSDIRDNLTIHAYNSTGSVKEVKIKDTIMKSTDFRVALSIQSTNFTMQVDDKYVTINVKGYGHGVGMSQLGAIHMAKEGKDYETILKHYYTGVEVGSLGDD